MALPSATITASTTGHLFESGVLIEYTA